MVLLLYLVVLLGVPFSGASGSAWKFTALQFGEGDPSRGEFAYVRFFPDFRPFARAVSACGWLKSIGSAPHSTVFTFTGNEMVVSHRGRWFCILEHCSLIHKLPPKGEWYHMCAVWSASSAFYRYYVNGELIGSMPTPSDQSLSAGDLGGPLTLGIRGGAYWSRSAFGGQMFFLNFYAKEFSAAEVKGMAASGMCLDMVLDQHQEVRLLKWEDILDDRIRLIWRRGNVTEVDLTEWCRSSLGHKYKELLKNPSESEVVGVRLVPQKTNTPGHSGEPVSPTAMSEFHPHNPDQCSAVTSKLHLAEEELRWMKKRLRYCRWFLDDTR